MICGPSYQAGFYAPKRGGVPAHPELWSGRGYACVGAWSAGLGPLGSRLFDWSGFGRHGSLVNMNAESDWVVSAGRYALDLDGVNDSITLPNLVQPLPFTVHFWIKPASLVSSDMRLFTWTAGATQFACRLQGTSIGVINATSTAWNAAVTGLTSDWAAITLVATSSSVTGYLNGRRSQTVAAAAAINGFRSFGEIYGSAFGGYYAGCVDDIFLCRGIVPEKPIAVYALRRGIAYELDRRSSVQVAASFNRRRRLLIGASS